MRHYVLLRTETRSAIHHARAEDGVITTAIVSGEPLQLDPPGIASDLRTVFAEA